MRFLTLLLPLLLFTVPASATSFRQLYQAVDHSVVVLHTTEKTQVRGKDREGQGVGSGVIISADGKIMTASHVVHIADTVKVEFWDGQQISARVIGSAPWADVALVQLDELPKNLQAARLGDSDTAAIGDEVFVVGNPYGLGRTLTTGHISARHSPPEVNDGLSSMEMFQTDAAINKGNSGGPMFNLDGEVIGIVSSILSHSGGSEGLGFAVTSNVAKRLLLEEKSRWAGLNTTLLAGPMARLFNLPQAAGLLVQQVAANSPAARLGLKAGTLKIKVAGKSFLAGGDIILEMLGVKIIPDAEFPARIHAAMNALQKGQKVSAKVLRGGEIVLLEGVVGQSGE